MVGAIAATALAAPAQADIHNFPHFGQLGTAIAAPCSITGTAVHRGSEFTLVSEPGSTCTGKLWYGVSAVGPSAGGVWNVAFVMNGVAPLAGCVSAAQTSSLIFLNSGGSVAQSGGHRLQISMRTDILAATLGSYPVDFDGGTPARYPLSLNPDGTNASGTLTFTALDGTPQACGASQQQRFSLGMTAGPSVRFNTVTDNIVVSRTVT